MSSRSCATSDTRRVTAFKLGGGAHLKKLRRAEGGAKILGVFRVKNHDFTPKNHIFSNRVDTASSFSNVVTVSSLLMTSVDL
jgi:hypothetical protein